MRTHRAGRWLVGAFVVAALALGIVTGGSGRAPEEYDWNAPASQFVAR